MVVFQAFAVVPPRNGGRGAGLGDHGDHGNHGPVVVSRENPTTFVYADATSYHVVGTDGATSTPSGAIFLIIIIILSLIDI